MNATVKRIAALIAARTALLWIRTPEEKRAQAGVVSAVRRLRSYDIRLWDVADGAKTLRGEPIPAGPPSAFLPDVVTYIRKLAESGPQGRQRREVWILADAHAWLTDGQSVRQLKNLALELPNSGEVITGPDGRKTLTKVGTVVCLVPESADPPPELAGVAVEIDYPRPDAEEIAEIIQSVMGGDVDAAELAAAADAARGLTGPEIEQAVAVSVSLSGGNLDPIEIARQKTELISVKGLTFRKPEPDGMERLGGNDRIKAWLAKRRLALSPGAQALGVPAPRGFLAMGVPGCGKTQLVSCMGSAWGLPIAQLDLGAVMGKYVGESQSSLRSTLAVVAAIAPCILFIDEVEKFLTGGASDADGNVTADQMGYLLQWLQDREGSVFTAFTANRPESLPPELTRAGRLDAVWFVDLPNATERQAIWRIFLTRAEVEVDVEAMLPTLVNLSQGWSGAEIEGAVTEAQTLAYSEHQGRVQAADLDAACRSIKPQSEREPEKLKKIRKWVTSGRAQSASEPETVATATSSGARFIETAA